MVNKKLYEKIMDSVSRSVVKILNERDFDAEGRWEVDEVWDDSEEHPHSVFEGWFDLNTNLIHQIGDDVDPIDPKTDEWGGLHKYVFFEAKPYEYNSYSISATREHPAEGETEIYSYDITCDPYTYTTTEFEGMYYFDDYDSTKEPFEGLTDEQEDIISEQLDSIVPIEFWDFY